MRSLRVALAREDGLAEARLARQHHQRGVGLRDAGEVEEVVGLAEGISTSPLRMAGFVE